MCAEGTAGCRALQEETNAIGTLPDSDVGRGDESLILSDHPWREAAFASRPAGEDPPTARGLGRTAGTTGGEGLQAVRAMERARGGRAQHPHGPRGWRQELWLGARRPGFHSSPSLSPHTSGDLSSPVPAVHWLSTLGDRMAIPAPPALEVVVQEQREMRWDTPGEEQPAKVRWCANLTHYNRNSGRKSVDCGWKSTSRRPWSLSFPSAVRKLSHHPASQSWGPSDLQT